MWSNKYMSIPFQDVGRTEQGADCWGLIKIAYKKELNIEIPSFNSYSDVSEEKVITELLCQALNSWIKIPLGEEKPYDLAAFNTLGIPAHVGIVVERPWVLHSLKDIGVQHTNYLEDPAWKKRLIGFYRHASNSGFSPPV